MLAELGGVEAARHLLAGPDAVHGFTTLWEAHRLELSVEAHVLLPRFETTFSASERRVARRRLEDHRFDVGGVPHLGRRGAAVTETEGVRYSKGISSMESSSSRSRPGDPSNARPNRWLRCSDTSAR